MPFNTKDGRISASDVDECLYAVAQDDVDALSRLYDLTGGAIYAYALSITKKRLRRGRRYARRIRQSVRKRP